MRKAVPLDCFHFADRVPGKTGGGTLHLCVAAGQVVRGSTNTRVRFAFLVRMRQKTRRGRSFAALSCMAAARVLS